MSFGIRKIVIWLGGRAGDHGPLRGAGLELEGTGPFFLLLENGGFLLLEGE